MRSRRILVYGVTGSGKSTLAARIAGRLGLPYHAMDDLTWEPGWIAVPEQEQRRRAAEVVATDAWVIDAAYGMWSDLVLARVELIVGLDLPRVVSLSRLLRRTVRHIVRRTPTCNGNLETWHNAFFDRESILRWHFSSFRRKRDRMRLWQSSSEYPPTVLLHSSVEVEQWLAALPRARAAVVAVHGDRLLVIRRSKHGRRYAVLPGGGVEDDESAPEAALRELREETGLVATTLRHLWTLDDDGRTADYYLVTVPAAPMRLAGPEAGRQSAENSYEPAWIGIADLAVENLQPESLRPLIRGLADGGRA